MTSSLYIFLHKLYHKMRNEIFHPWKWYTAKVRLGSSPSVVSIHDIDPPSLEIFRFQHQRGYFSVIGSKYNSLKMFKVVWKNTLRLTVNSWLTRDQQFVLTNSPFRQSSEFPGICLQGRKLWMSEPYGQQARLLRNYFTRVPCDYPIYIYIYIERER